MRWPWGVSQTANSQTPSASDSASRAGSCAQRRLIYREDFRKWRTARLRACPNLPTGGGIHAKSSPVSGRIYGLYLAVEVEHAVVVVILQAIAVYLVGETKVWAYPQIVESCPVHRISLYRCAVNVVFSNFLFCLEAGGNGRRRAIGVREALGGVGGVYLRATSEVAGGHKDGRVR